MNRSHVIRLNPTPEQLAGVTTRSNGETHRKYQVNESFFDVINTESKAYWLGFLTADATILDRGFVVALKQGDTGHLEKLKADSCSTHPIKMPSAFFSHLITSDAQVRPHQAIFSMRFSSTALSRMVLQHLYQGSTVYLDRKYKLYQELDSQLAKSGQKFACGAGSSGSFCGESATFCDEVGTKML